MNNFNIESKNNILAVNNKTITKILYTFLLKYRRYYKKLYVLACIRSFTIYFFKFMLHYKMT